MLQHEIASVVFEGEVRAYVVQEGGEEIGGKAIGYGLRGLIRVSRASYIVHGTFQYLPLSLGFAITPHLRTCVPVAKMSDSAFATLAPKNALARLAFSELYDSLTAGRQNAEADGNPALDRMTVELQQIFDGEVLHLRLEADKRVSENSQNAAYLSDAETSESLAEPDSDIEEQYKELGLIWRGHYFLTLESLPSVPHTGYAIGKGPLENIPNDLLLCTKSFAKWHGINLRNPHARFNFFPDTRGLYIAGCSRSPLAQLTVDGEAVRLRPYLLNRYSMNIGLDKLEYVFQWTDFAATNNFSKVRNGYVAGAIGARPVVDIDMPTPLSSSRTIGKWTLGDVLGKGGRGRVFFASNTSGEMAAIKLIERTSQNHRAVDDEIQVCKDVTAAAERVGDDKRILRVVDIIYTNNERFLSTMAFDNVAIVLQPLTPKTLADWVGVRSNR